MNCFTHERVAAVGVCSVCQRGACTAADPVTMRPKVARGVIAVCNIAVGGLAVGSVAFGGAAVGFVYAIGGGAIGPSIIDGRRCDEAAREFIRSWLGSGALPPSCR